MTEKGCGSHPSASCNMVWCGGRGLDDWLLWRGRNTCIYANIDTYTKAVCPAATQKLCSSLYVALASHIHKWSKTMFHVVFPVFHLLSLTPLSSPSQHPSILFPQVFFIFVFLLWPFLYLTISLQKGCLYDKFKPPLLQGQNIIQKAWQKSRGKEGSEGYVISASLFSHPANFWFLWSFINPSINFIFLATRLDPPNLTRRQLSQIERKLFAMQYNSPPTHIHAHPCCLLTWYRLCIETAPAEAVSVSVQLSEPPHTCTPTLTHIHTTHTTHGCDDYSAAACAVAVGRRTFISLWWWLSPFLLVSIHRLVWNMTGCMAHLSFMSILLAYVNHLHVNMCNIWIYKHFSLCIHVFIDID